MKWAALGHSNLGRGSVTAGDYVTEPTSSVERAKRINLMRCTMQLPAEIGLISLRELAPTIAQLPCRLVRLASIRPADGIGTGAAGRQTWRHVGCRIVTADPCQSPLEPSPATVVTIGGC